MTHTYRALQWSDEQGSFFATRVIRDAFHYHERALQQARWRIGRYDDVKTHHRAIHHRQVSDLTVHTRCLGNGQAQTILDVKVR